MPSPLKRTTSTLVRMLTLAGTMPGRLETVTVEPLIAIV